MLIFHAHERVLLGEAHEHGSPQKVRRGCRDVDPDVARQVLVQRVLMRLFRKELLNSNVNLLLPDRGENSLISYDCVRLSLLPHREYWALYDAQKHAATDEFSQRNR